MDEVKKTDEGTIADKIGKLKESVRQSATGHLPLPERPAGMPDFPEELIKEGLAEIASSAQGHLSRPSRHNILRALRSSRMAGRIGILCALKVLPAWRKWSGDSHEIIGLLRKAEYYLWGKTSREEVVRTADRVSALVEGRDYGDDFAPLMAGMSAVQAAYDAVTDDNLCEEVAEDDGEIESDEWDAAFLASLSCNKGASDIAEIDAESNRKFWTWYLTDCIPFVYESERHPGHRADNSIRIPVPISCDAALSDSISRLNSALGSYIHAPANRKEILRMQPFAADEGLVRAVVDFLQGYSCIPSNAQELEDYCMAGHFCYDSVKFWYCVALLALSPDSRALDCLTRLARILMEQGPGDLNILYRIVLLLPEQEHLHGLNRELADYYKKIIPTLASAKWLAKADIPYPDDFEWRLSFRFTSDGETIPVPGNQKEKKAWFALTVEMFGPRTLLYDYTRFTSYRIHVCNADNSIHGDWNEKDGFLLRDEEWLMKDELYTPDRLVLLMHKLAGYGIRFSKVPVNLYASKGISRKSVENRIKDEMEAYEDDRMREVRDNALDIPAKPIPLRKQMPRERMEWPDDGCRYITRGFAGYFAYGEWRPKDVEKWQGTFVADLRIVPLQPVKFKTKKIHSFRYSEELDFYAALYSVSFGEIPIGGKNPLEAEKWPRMSGLSVDGKYEYLWCGRYLCLGDVHVAIVHTMTERGVEHVSQAILPEGLMYAPGFGIDGKGTLYITLGEYSRSRIIRYDDKGKYTMMPFRMSGYDTFSHGSIPVPDTTRILLQHEYTARSNSGIWSESGLLDLDMATQQCRIAPLRIGDGSFRLRVFHGEWVLAESCSNGNRTDYARLWNRKTDEVLRIRPGVFSGESFVRLHIQPDGTVVVNTLDDTGDVLYRIEDFWNFLRTAGRPKKLGYWLNYPKPYPDIDYELPPLSEDATLMLAPPFTEYPSANPPAAKPRQARYSKDRPSETSDAQVSDGIEITEGVLKINGQKEILPLSYTAMVRIFGKEKAVFTHRTMQDDTGKTVQYDRRGFLVWDDAGVTAARNEENAYNISTVYLWVAENKEPARSLPVPAGTFGGEIVVDGIRWDRKSDRTVRSGKLEIAASATEGYMEITFADVRDRKDTWQHYRDAMAENLQSALVQRDCIKRLERNARMGKTPESASKSFFAHTIQALHAGYAMGRSERYLKANLLLPLIEAASKCLEYGTMHTFDALSVYSGCILLGCEKVHLKRLGETMAERGIRDFVFDTLIRCRIPDWEVTERTAFPEIKEWITLQAKNKEVARPMPKEIARVSGNILIADALLMSTN